MKKLLLSLTLIGLVAAPLASSTAASLTDQWTPEQIKAKAALDQAVPGPIVAQVDTNIPPVISGPGWELIQFLSSGSNWMAGVDFLYDKGSEEIGGGVLFGYKLSDYVVTMAGLEYLNQDVWMPSASVQLQLPLKLFNAVEMAPLTYAGLTTPIGADVNDDVVGIFGAGLAVRVTPRISVFGAAEKRTGFAEHFYRGGILYKF